MQKPLNEYTAPEFYYVPNFTEEEANALAAQFLQGRNPNERYQLVQELLQLEIDSKIGENKDPQLFLRGGPARAALVYECKINQVVDEKMAKAFFSNPQAFLKKYKMPDFLLNHFSSIIDRLAAPDAFGDTRAAMHWVYFNAVQPLIIAQATTNFNRDPKMNRVNAKYPNQTNLTPKQNDELTKVRSEAVAKYYGSTKKYFTSDPEKISKEYGQLLDSSYNAMQKVQAEGNLGRLARGMAIEQPRHNKFVDTLKRTFGRRAGADIVKNPDPINNSNIAPTTTAVQPKTSSPIDIVAEIRQKINAIREDLGEPMQPFELDFVTVNIEQIVTKIEDLKNTHDCDTEDVIQLCDELQEACKTAYKKGMSDEENENFMQRLDAVKEEAQQIQQSRANYL